MTWDLRSRYAFDATEGQIPEGQVSVYGPANSHANCVPASFTAALELAGFPDIDPQSITNEVFGPNYRGGFGDFSKAIAWIKANVAGAPSFTDSPFEFAAADAAGAAGRLVIVAGWIDPASVTFTPAGSGFSHASLLAAHLANDTFVIWNTWTGQLQTYSRPTLAASLYEMAVMNTGENMPLPEPERTWLLRLYVREFGTAATGADPTLAPYQAAGDKERAELDAIAVAVAKAPAPTAVVDVPALAAALAPLLSAQNKPPVAPQVVKDWIISLLKSWGWL